MSLSWAWAFLPKMIGSQLRIRVSEVEDVAEDFQQFQFPELDGAWKGGLWSYNPKVLVSSGLFVLACFCWGEEHLKKTRGLWRGIGVCNIQKMSPPKTEVHLMSSGWSHLPGILKYS